MSSVAVTNLKTGVRKGGVDRVEVTLELCVSLKLRFLQFEKYIARADDVNSEQIYFNEIPEETIEKLVSGVLYKFKTCISPY